MDRATTDVGIRPTPHGKMMADFVPTIPEWFQTRRAAQVTAFFANKSGGRINVLKATKLVYLADRLSMERREFPITADNLVSMPFGPVNSFTYNYMQGTAPVRTEQWAEFIGPRVGHDIPLARPIEDSELDELSEADREILSETWEAFKDIDRFDLADWTHRYCPEWRNPHGSSVPIEYATVFKKLGKDDPVELAEQVQAERNLLAEFFDSE